MLFNNKLSRIALAGVAFSAFSMMTPAAFASGNDDVDALRKQVKELMARLEKLEKAPAPAPAPAAPAANKPAANKDAPLVAADVFKAPQVVQSGNNKVKLTLTGSINRAVTFADDGFNTDTIHVDNGGNSSRIRLVGQAKLSDEWTAGTDLELEAVSGSSRNTGFGTDGNGFAFNERKIEVWVESKTLGRLWIGQGDASSNVSSEVDLSGTGSVIGYSDVGATFGGIAFRNKATRANGPTINAAFNNFDGLNRDDRIRYDTPEFQGFRASTSFLEGGATDVTLRYNGKVGTTTLAGAIAYANADSRNDFTDQVSGSFAVRLENGFNVAVAAGTREQNNRVDSNFWYAKAGYIGKLNSLGSTSLLVDYYNQDDLVADGNQSKAIGAAVFQTVDAISTDFYAGIRNHMFESRTANFKDVFAIQTGARLRF
jgi:hypothetical protein